MPSLAQNFSQSIGLTSMSFNKTVTVPHDQSIDITLAVGTPVILNVSQLFGTGSFSFAVSSTYQQLNPYTPSPFTITIDSGTVMEFDDLCVLNLSVRPTQITLGLPSGATAAVNVHVSMAGQ